MAHRNVFAEGEGRWKKGGGTNWLCVWIRHANIIRARIIIYAAKTNSCCSGGEMAEKLMTFGKQKSKSSSSSPAAGVAIRMSEHAWRCRRPCSAAVCKLALKCCLSGGQQPWAAILWISFQSFLLLLLFTSVHRHDGTQSWGLRITTAFALTCFHFIWTKDHWGCSSLWCNPALRLKAQISILVVLLLSPNVKTTCGIQSVVHESSKARLNHQGAEDLRIQRSANRGASQSPMKS